MFKTLALPINAVPSWLHSLVLVILSSILIGLFANLAIPLPFSPVPIATQCSLILVLSCLLGSKRSFAAVLCFLAQGAAGLPVFAGGSSGFPILLGPTGGYLFGYLAASFLVGFLSERMKDRTPLKLFGAMALGNALFFLFGVPYLSTFIGFKQALLVGFAPFIVGDFLKLVLGVKILQWVRG